jgi:hypothetical protein
MAAPSTQGLLLVDFGSVGGKALADLVPRRLMAGPHLALDPLGWPWDASTVLTDRAAQIAVRLVSAGARAGHLIAQCSGAGFALELFAQMTRLAAEPVRITLVDPICVTADVVAAHVEQIAAQHTDADRLGPLRAEAAARAADPPALVSWAVSRLRELAMGRVAKLPLPDADKDAVVDQLLERYVAWLGFLAAQVGHRSPAPHVPVHVLGADPPELDRQLRALVVDSGTLAAHVARCPDPAAVTVELDRIGGLPDQRHPGRGGPLRCVDPPTVAVSAVPDLRGGS